jgi:sialic acid synthase SpsE
MTLATATHPQAQTLALGGRAVGDGRPAFVIAEAGVNHNGSVQRALEMIDVAAGTGVDAVKFQMFRADDLVTAAAPQAQYQRQAALDSQRELLRRLELGRGDFDRLADHCRDRSVAFLCTPFGIPEAGQLIEIGVAAIKLASTDLNNTPLLHAVIEADVPIVLSTGAATEQEIGVAVGLFERFDAVDRLVLLHCVSAYPTPPEAANIAAVRTLRARFGVLTGYSDHTQLIETGGWAVASGACVIEKHFTLDRGLAGPDHAMSLEPDDLGRYVATIRQAERTLGDGRIGYHTCEADVRAVARKSVVVTRRVPAGARIALDMLTVKRPGGGIVPGDLDGLVGRVARVEIPADTMLQWGMLE